MSQKLKNPRDAEDTRFEGNGVEFRGKMIGVEDIDDSRGDKLCADALMRLKNRVKSVGAHKPKIIINITAEGLRITDVISKEVIHNHAVHRISFISRDTTDNRAFGYIYSDNSGQHKFFAIKTALSAEMLVLTLRDLFTYVYKGRQEQSAQPTSAAESANDDAVVVATDSSAIDVVNQDVEYMVPQSDAPVIVSANSTEIPKLAAPSTAKKENLLDLVEQPEIPAKQTSSAFDEFDAMFDQLHEDTTSSSPNLSSERPNSDLLQLSAPTPSSVLNGIVSLAPPVNPFSPAQTTAFGQTTSPLAQPSSAQPSSLFSSSLPQSMTQPLFTMPDSSASSLPPNTIFTPATTMNDPFGDNFMKQTPHNEKPATNPFSLPSKSLFDDPFFPPSSQGVADVWGGPSMVRDGDSTANASSSGFVPSANPFLLPSANPSVPLQPLMPEAKKLPETGQTRPTRVSKDSLFKDLVPITNPAAPFKTPKEMFTDLSNVPRKTLNEMQFDAKSDFLSSDPNPQASNAPPNTDLFAKDLFAPLTPDIESPDPFIVNTSFISNVPLIPCYKEPPPVTPALHLSPPTEPPPPLPKQDIESLKEPPKPPPRPTPKNGFTTHACTVTTQKSTKIHFAVSDPFNDPFFTGESSQTSFS